MRKIKAVQIGSAHDHAIPAVNSLKKQTDIFDCVGYVIPAIEKELYPERNSAFAGLREMTIEEVLADDSIEAVIVETEEVTLTDYALMAAKAGKHIHMDKPGGLDPAAFKTLLTTMKQNGLVFHTGYMYRYNSEVQKAMEMVRNGDFGEIFSVEAHMDCRHTPQKRQWLSAFPGGMMFFLGCHLVDLIFGILGTPEKIIPYNMSTGIDGVTAEDYGFAVFRYKNGLSFAKTCAEEIGGFARRQLVITGSKCSLELKPLEMFTEGGQYTGRTVYTNAGDWGSLGESSRSRPQDRYDGMLAAFAAMVRGEKQNPWSYEYEWKLYRTVLAACGVDIDYKSDEIL